MVVESPHEDKRRLISLSEAAEMFGFNSRYLGELARKGRLVAQKVGHSWVTTPGDMRDFIESRQKKGAFREDITLD